MPLLGSVECGSFLIFASPTIYIPDYDQDKHDQPVKSSSHLHQANNKGQAQTPTAKTFASQYRERSLTAIYGQNVYLNQQHMAKKGKNGGTQTQSFRFLQENLDEIDDDLLKMMPLLKNLTKQNVIPIMDFEDNTQSELNFLVLHAAECIPSVSISQSVALVIPQDQAEAIRYVSIPDVRKVTVR